MIRLRESSVSLREIEKDSLTGLYTEQAFFHYSRRIMQFRSDKKMHVIIGRIKDFELIISIYGRKKKTNYFVTWLLYITKNLNMDY